MAKKQTGSITPYANESEVLTVGNITIENRTDRITIHGDTDITKDKEGLAKALALKQVIDSILDALKEDELPDKIEMTKPSNIHNPFNQKK